MTITATPTGDSPRYHAVPAFPGAFAELAGVASGGQLAMIANRLDTVRKAYAKHTKWLEACAVYSAGGAQDAPNVRTMPSKDAKHRMYGAAGDLTRACGWDAAATRCHSLDDIACLIAAVESLLRG